MVVEPQDPDMTLEAARKVRWHRHDPRPLGELLDEGTLREKDLQWAAQNAYRTELRQAARVLLRALAAQTPVPDDVPATAPSIHAPLPLETARATIWPFRPLQGQSMGHLLDAKQLHLKDLGYAIENAWDIRVQRAAQTLMLERLQQVIEEPPAEVRFLNVYSAGRSFALGQQFQLTLVQGLIFGVIMGVLLTLLGASIVDWLQPRDPGAREQATTALQSTWETQPGLLILSVFAVIGLVVGSYVIMLFVLDRVDKALTRQIRLYRKGEEGENAVVEIMQQALDSNWHLFRNLKFPGRDKSDIDLIVVGPSGVIAIEVKYWTGVYRNVGDMWERRTRTGWQTVRRSPGKQARRNAGLLSSFFKADGIVQWVEPVVIWSNPEAPLTVDNPSVTVWTLEQISAALTAVKRQRPGDNRELSQIVDKLIRLTQQQRKRIVNEDGDESS